MFQQSPFVSQIYVHGDSLQSYLVAVVVPDFDTIQTWLTKHRKLNLFSIILAEAPCQNIPTEICNCEEIKKLILESLNQLATENKFNSLERIKKVHLVTQEFIHESAEMITPSMKVKRNVAAKFYKNQIDSMYRS